jgi:hypothetical protein
MKSGWRWSPSPNPSWPCSAFPLQPDRVLNFFNAQHKQWEKWSLLAMRSPNKSQEVPFDKQNLCCYQTM